MTIKAGALDGVDGIFGMHIWSEIEAGPHLADPGQRMANTDWFSVDIEGVSAHGSMPHKGVDAVVVAAELVVALQVLVSGHISSSFEPLVVTVGEVHGGEARNIMAGSAYSTAPRATADKKTREAMPDRLRRLIDRSAKAFGATAKLTYEAGNAGLSNDKKSAERAQVSVKKLFGEEALADYQDARRRGFRGISRPSAGRLSCFFPGCRNPKMDAVHAQHSCYYRIHESVLAKGSYLLQRNTRSISWLNSAANGTIIGRQRRMISLLSAVLPELPRWRPHFNLCILSCAKVPFKCDNNRLLEFRNTHRYARFLCGAPVQRLGVIEGISMTDLTKKYGTMVFSSTRRSSVFLRIRTRSCPKPSKRASRSILTWRIPSRIP